MTKLIKKNYTEKQIQKLLINEFLQFRKHKLVACNIFLYNWESDFITIDRENYITEIEIKCSKWDYLNDFKKEDKHQAIQQLRITDIPNYFYYVMPENMIEQNNIPEYAGLIIIKYGGLKFVKKAPILHQEKFDRFEEIATKLMYKLI